MYDEDATVVSTVTRTGADWDFVGVIQSTDGATSPVVEDALQDHCHEWAFGAAENLGKQYSRWELPAQALCRNFSMLFSMTNDEALHEITHWVAITGDTALLHTLGVRSIIRKMGDAGIACAKAVGNDFHAAHHTEEDLKGGAHGGRIQTSSISDFMPQLFIVRAPFASRFADIAVTNRWTSEQCLGDAAGDAPQYAFSLTAYGFSDGVLYHAR